MIMAFAGICAFVCLICSANDGNWGTFALVAVVVAVIVFMMADDRKTVRAWDNLQDYWAKGGPDRK